MKNTNTLLIKYSYWIIEYNVWTFKLFKLKMSNNGNKLHRESWSFAGSCCINIQGSIQFSDVNVNPFYLPRILLHYSTSCWFWIMFVAPQAGIKVSLEYDFKLAIFFILQNCGRAMYLFLLQRVIDRRHGVNSVTTPSVTIFWVPVLIGVFQHVTSLPTPLFNKLPGLNFAFSIIDWNRSGGA